MLSRNLRRCGAVFILPLVLGIAGCASTTTRMQTASELDRILAMPHRPAANRARDIYRHPKETLLFFGLRPEMTVL